MSGERACKAFLKAKAFAVMGTVAVNTFCAGVV
jgi:hypothetical protein